MRPERIPGGKPRRRSARKAQPGILLLLIEVDRPVDLRFVADLGNQRAVFALLDDERLLRVREFTRFRPFPLLSHLGKRSEKLQLQTV